LQLHRVNIDQGEATIRRKFLGVLVAFGDYYRCRSHFHSFVAFCLTARGFIEWRIRPLDDITALDAARYVAAVPSAPRAVPAKSAPNYGRPRGVAFVATLEEAPILRLLTLARLNFHFPIKPFAVDPGHRYFSCAFCSTPR
jgi:hypothetical protein